MNGTLILENTIPVSLVESWQMSCSTLLDRPLSAALWNLGEMTGEEFLDELAPLQVNPLKLRSECN
ncbi:MAG: hypothetical protein JXA46_15730 [Dehalococcoidales bacterium]|nr:hypothetical protein [Dehalococcoidales bacterium]